MIGINNSSVKPHHQASIYKTTKSSLLNCGVSSLARGVGAPNMALIVLGCEFTLTLHKKGGFKMKTKNARLGSLNVIVCVFLILGGLLSIATPDLEAKTITLRYATHNPNRGVEAESAIWMMDEITKRTNGGVKFQQYFGQSLLKVREILRGIQNRTTDMGLLGTAVFPKELPQWQVTLPFIQGPVDPKKKAAFFWEFYEQSPELKTELAGLNQRLVAIAAFGNMSIGGPKPLKALAEIKGMRVRCAGGYDAKHVTDLGAKVVFIPGPEVYSAMQKGALDVNYAPVTTYHKYRLYEIGESNHLLVIPQFQGMPFLININMDTWESLPAEVQQIISQVGKEYSKIQTDKISTAERQDRDEMAKAGCTIIDLSKEDVQHWADISEKGCIAKWVEEAQKMGLEGEKLMERTIGLIKKYSD